jgi:hypothetical protein
VGERLGRPALAFYRAVRRHDGLHLLSSGYFLHGDIGAVGEQLQLAWRRRSRRRRSLHTTAHTHTRHHHAPWQRFRRPCGRCQRSESTTAGSL